MTTNYLLSLDVGGGGGRCLLINPENGEFTVTYRAWNHPASREAGAWSYDLDTALVWRLLAETVKTTLAKAGAQPAQVAGIAATGMRHGMVVVDAAGEPLLARPNKDARAVEQSMALAGERGQAIYQRSGHWPTPICMASALLWMKAHTPQALDAARAVLSVSDWVAYRLTGELAAEATQAAESLLFDLEKQEWAQDLMAELGLRREIFPRIAQAGERLGLLCAGAAEHLGLSQGIPVAVGGADTQSGLLGAGVVSPGQLGVINGTTAPVQWVCKQAHIDPHKRLWTSVHIIPGLYVLESNAGNMGDSLAWFARALYPDLPDPVGALIAEASGAPPGAGGVFSTLGASVFNAAEMGLPIDHLTFTTADRRYGEGGRALLARAVVEGQAFALQANIEQIERIAGGDVGDIYLGGGMARSQTWAEILCQASGRTVKVVAIPESTALGAAICAGIGAGIFRDQATGAQALVKYARQHEPAEEVHKHYRSLYQDWCALRKERQAADELAASIFTQSMGARESSVNAPEEIFRPRIYVSADMGETALEALRALGEVTYASYREGALLVGEELVETLQGYHVFVTEVDVVDAEVLRELPDLRVVAACRGNPVNIDIAACTAAGVPVVNTPGRNADAVADLAVGFMLMLARKLGEAAAFLRQPGGEAGDMGRMGQAYFSYQGNELWNKTVGIVGAGAIGRRVIRRLLPFEARLLVCDPLIDAEQAALLGARKVELDELLRESDMISLHAPVTDETRDMIDAAAFEKMKPGAFLVNTARAALVDDQALIAALQSGRLGGAALDVFRVEPPGADDPLLAFPNVIATPHLGGNTFEVGVHQGMIVAGELKLLLAGKRPQHVLNPQTLEGFSWTGERRVAREALEQLAAGPGPSVSDLQVEGAQTREALSEGKQSVHKDGLLKRLFKRKDAEMDAATLAAPSAPAHGGAPRDSQRETMIRILEQFTVNLRSDDQMAQASRGKEVVMHFTVKDLEQVFYLSFLDGAVDAALGEPPVEPHVRLKMDADILDGMFTGRVSGNKAAMTGKLSFSGDTRKAMAFQRFTRDMERLYQAARQQVGDPGDLKLLGAAVAKTTQAVQTADLQAMSAVNAAQAPAVFKVGDVRDEILQVTNELYARGLITATGGNVSARTDDNPNEVWITPSAIFKGDLRPEMMVRIDLSGNLVGDHPYSASSERRVHCAIYRACPEINAVIHTHAPQATIMALSGTGFLPVSTEAAFIGDVPVVPFIMPGTDELGEQVAKALGDGVAVIMQNHGLVVAGSSPRRAADMTEIVEATAEKILTCKALGVEPALLPQDVLEELREIGKMLV